jgi:hypothetical protein
MAMRVPRMREARKATMVTLSVTRRPRPTAAKID